MRAHLVRIGVDQAFGGWNAPMNPDTNQFVFVPIPESRPMTTDLRTPYALVQPALATFEAAQRRRSVQLAVRALLPFASWMSGEIAADFSTRLR
jgi:hypothetical protein